MKELSAWALNIANQRGATYADVRVVDERSRALATKNAKIGNASDSRSQGFNIRVLIDGAWGFASSAELERAAVEATAARAVEIAKASAQVKQSDVRLVPERFPVKSRLHGGWKGLVFNTFFVGTFNALPRGLVRRFGWHLLAFCTK